MHAFGFGLHLDGRLGDVGGDLRRLRRAAGAEDAEAGDIEHPRQRIEHDPVAADAGVVAFEIGPVVGDIVGERGVEPGGESVKLAGLGRGQGDALALDMQHMVRRRIAARGEFGGVLGVAEVEDRGTGAEGQNHPLRAAFDRASAAPAGRAGSA